MLMTPKKLSDLKTTELEAMVLAMWDTLFRIEKQELKTHRANSKTRKLAKEQLEKLTTPMGEHMRAVLATSFGEAFKKEYVR